MSADPAEPPPRSGKQYLPVALGLGALVAAGVALAILLLPADDAPDTSEPTYSATVEEVFVASCVADGGEPVRPICECFFDGIVEAIPYERYQEVNERLLASPPATGEPLPLPDDFDAVLADCRRPSE